METNLERLWNDAVITKETYEWLKPLHDQETADLEEIKAAAEERKNNPFYQDDDDDDSDSDSSNDDEHGNGNGNGMMTTSTKTIKGIEGTNTVVSFVTDSNSSGHGDKVWHASIATCRYLKERFLSLTLDGSETKKKNNTSSPFRCLELGAGTAVPSFFLAQMLLLRNQNDARIEEDNNDTDQDQQQQQQHQNIILRITDAKVYRNVMQILRSVELQESPTKGERCVLHAQKQDSPLRIEVHPHNWGDDNISFGIGTAADDQAADDSEEDTDPLLQHDLVIVSDCIYNPEFHDDLLISLSRTLSLPTMDTITTTTTTNRNEKKSKTKSNGGVAVVSFSLHGNVQDSAIWDFLDQKLPSTMRNNIIDSEVVAWRLHAKCVSTEPQLETQLQSREEQQPTNEIEAQQLQQQQQPVIREGWNMESTMIDLGMVTEGMQSERWLAYVYEITWVEA